MNSGTSPAHRYPLRHARGQNIWPDTFGSEPRQRHWTRRPPYVAARELKI